MALFLRELSRTDCISSIWMKAGGRSISSRGFGAFLRAEYPFLIGLATAAFFLVLGSAVLENVAQPIFLVAILIVLLSAVLWSAISAVHHAECLAIKCGEPYGTLILTLSVISIEVMMISAAMLHGANNPTLARDAIFLVIQTGRHRQYFKDGGAASDPSDRHSSIQPRSAGFHATMLFLYLVVVIVLAEKFAIPLDNCIERFGMPQAFGGAIVAGLVLAPEALAAIKSARQNQLQRSVNILHGSVLATIGLTIPAVLIIGMITNRPVVLGIQGGNLPLLVRSEE